MILKQLEKEEFEIQGEVEKGQQKVPKMLRELC